MRILVVEDEVQLAEAVARGLRREGMAVDIAIDGDDGYRKAVLTRYDVVVLDRDLPGMSGDEICRRLSDEGVLTRVLMLTASGTVEDKVAGLALGADDYLAKPFAFAELVARVRALGRRTTPAAPPVLTAGDLELDSARRIVTRGGEVIELTRKEFGVLETLLTAQGAVVSSEELLDRVWDENADPFTTTVRGHHDDPAAKTRRTSHHRDGGGLRLSHRSWRARAVRRGGRIGAVRIFRPTLRIRMALLYGGLVLLVGVSLLVLALLLLDRAVGNLGIFANGQGTATITVNGHSGLFRPDPGARRSGPAGRP
jgi:DNA-binding response OmpR family regulator